MREHRKPQIWPWIAALLVGLPVLYVASFGAACWWASDHEDELGLHSLPAPSLFWPFGRARIRAPKVVSRAICRLATLCGEPLSIPASADGEVLTPCNPR